MRNQNVTLNSSNACGMMPIAWIMFSCEPETSRRNSVAVGRGISSSLLSTAVDPPLLCVPNAGVPGAGLIPVETTSLFQWMRGRVKMRDTHWWVVIRR